MTRPGGAVGGPATSAAGRPRAAPESGPVGTR